MAIVELVTYSPMGFKLLEAAFCLLGAIFVSNWRMKYWNVPIFALLITTTFGYAFVSILLIFITFTEKPRHFVYVVLTGFGSALSFLAANLMIVRIFVLKVQDVKGEESYHYTSEGLLAFWMYLCFITMLLDVTCISPPIIVETHSSTEEEDEDDDEIRRKSQHAESIQI